MTRTNDSDEERLLGERREMIHQQECELVRASRCSEFRVRWQHHSYQTPNLKTRYGTQEDRADFEMRE